MNISKVLSVSAQTTFRRFGAINSSVRVPLPRCIPFTKFSFKNRDIRLFSQTSHGSGRKERSQYAEDGLFIARFFAVSSACIGGIMIYALVDSSISRPEYNMEKAEIKQKIDQFAVTPDLSQFQCSEMVSFMEEIWCKPTEVIEHFQRAKTGWLCDALRFDHVQVLDCLLGGKADDANNAYMGTGDHTYLCNMKGSVNRNLLAHYLQQAEKDISLETLITMRNRSWKKVARKQDYDEFLKQYEWIEYGGYKDFADVLTTEIERRKKLVESRG